MEASEQRAGASEDHADRQRRQKRFAAGPADVVDPDSEISRSLIRAPVRRDSDREIDDDAQREGPLEGAAPKPDVGEQKRRHRGNLDERPANGRKQGDDRRPHDAGRSGDGRFRSGLLHAHKDVPILSGRQVEEVSQYCYRRIMTLPTQHYSLARAPFEIRYALYLTLVVCLGAFLVLASIPVSLFDLASTVVSFGLLFLSYLLFASRDYL